MTDHDPLYNDTPAFEAAPVVEFGGAHLDEADIRDLELIRSRRSLAYLKDRIGNDAMLELLADDLDAAATKVTGWLDASDGRWRSDSLTMTVPGPAAEAFHAWFMGNMKRGNETLFRAGHPDHFMNHPLPDGRAQVIKNVGEDNLPWHIFLTFTGSDTALPTPWDPDYPLELGFGAKILDVHGTRIGSAMHELRDTDDGHLQAKLTVSLPQAAPAELVVGHLRHFSIEFRNWTEMARHGVGALTA